MIRVDMQLPRARIAMLTERYRDAIATTNLTQTHYHNHFCPDHKKQKLIHKNFLILQLQILPHHSFSLYPNLPKCELDRLTTIQNTLTRRVVSRSKRHDHWSPQYYIFPLTNNTGKNQIRTYYERAKRNTNQCNKNAWKLTFSTFLSLHSNCRQPGLMYGTWPGLILILFYFIGPSPWCHRISLT